MCAESRGAVACTNILGTRWAKFYWTKWRDIGERDGKVPTQLTFSSSLPQSLSVVLKISALYLRISALRLPTVICQSQSCVMSPEHMPNFFSFLYHTFRYDCEEKYDIFHTFYSKVSNRYTSRNKCGICCGIVCFEHADVAWRIPLTKDQYTELWFFFMYSWSNGWTNNGFAGDLRCHDAHVMLLSWYLDFTKDTL